MYYKAGEIRFNFHIQSITLSNHLPQRYTRNRKQRNLYLTYPRTEWGRSERERDKDREIKRNLNLYMKLA